jgi:hypothetical protein
MLSFRDEWLLDTSLNRGTVVAAFVGHGSVPRDRGGHQIRAHHARLSALLRDPFETTLMVEITREPIDAASRTGPAPSARS